MKYHSNYADRLLSRRQSQAGCINTFFINDLAQERKAMTALQKFKSFQKKMSHSRTEVQRRQHPDQFVVSAFTVAVTDRNVFEVPVPHFTRKQTVSIDQLDLEKTYFDKVRDVGRSMRITRKKTPLTNRQSKVSSSQEISTKEQKKVLKKQCSMDDKLNHSILQDAPFTKYKNRSSKVMPRLPKTPDLPPQTNRTSQTVQRRYRNATDLRNKTSRKKYEAEEGLDLRPWDIEALQADV